jgi:formylglycine-generating enzyme required for sulfatase activity
VGSNQLLVRVTAEDGTTTKDYDIRVYRMGADYTSATIGTLKYIPAGAFQRDGTNHDISYVSALRMSRTEITRAQYSARMGTDPADPTYSSGIGDPVQTVNWYHAIAFCNRLSLAEGLEPVYTVSGVDFNSLQHADVPLTNNSTWNVVSNNWLATGYRLPTEMEWMWAAMGAQMGSDPFTVNTTGYGKAFAGSTGSNAIGEYAWYGHYSSGSATAARTTVAGSKLPNELGLVDMSGNVWGLCHDWYGDYPAGYQADYRGAVSGTYRVNRGGSWYRIASSCAVAYRYYNFPSHREFGAGFRVVRP